MAFLNIPVFVKGAYVEKASLGSTRTLVGTAKISLNNGASTGIVILGGQTGGTLLDDVYILNVEENEYIYSGKFQGGPRYEYGF